MISYLSGRAIASDTVLVSGVGFHVWTPAPLPVGEDVDLWTHMAVRENDISLYGFHTQGERDLFLALTRVTGVGPRLALTMLSLGAAEVAGAVAAQDARALARAPGVGPKKASQILAAVRVPPEVLAALTDAPLTAADPGPGDDLLDTLVRLGHPAEACRAALAQARQEVPQGPVQLVLRSALRALAASPQRLAG